MQDIEVLLTVVLIMVGFGLVLLLGIVLPHDSPKDGREEDEEFR